MIRFDAWHVLFKMVQADLLSLKARGFCQL